MKYLEMPRDTYRLFMAASEWIDTNDGSTRTSLNGIVVEIIRIGQRRYQPFAKGPYPYASFGRPCQCDTLEEAKKYAWACFNRLLDPKAATSNKRAAATPTF